MAARARERERERGGGGGVGGIRKDILNSLLAIYLFTGFWPTNYAANTVNGSH